MSFFRTILVAIATFFTVGIATAFAGCGGCGYGGWGGYGGGWGGYGGCGGCGVSYAPMIYAAPVVTYAVPVTTYVQPIAPAPIYVGGGCNCGASVGYGASAIAPNPYYVVNQGPEYNGPGITVPYHTYNPDSAYAPVTSYPYISGGYAPRPYYRARYAYGAGGYGRQHYYGRHLYRPAPHWRMYPRPGYNIR